MLTRKLYIVHTEDVKVHEIQLSYIFDALLWPSR